VVWWNLVVGAVLLVSFSCLFGAPRLRMHAVMVGMLGASIGLVLMVIVLLDNPFLGTSHVSVEPFQALSMAVETMDYPKPAK
jgi:ABC-type branched-subunit amino acid transport system permease subunit